jgi:protein SCO1/2
MNATVKESPKSRRLLIFAVLITALGAGLAIGAWIQGRSVSLEDINATVLEPPAKLDEFELMTHLGSPFTLDSLQGKWTFMFFGYTHCPDICPTTMGTLTQMDKILLEQDAELARQVVFVSVDPERDTIEKLSQYVPYFDPSYIGVTGNRANINRFTRKLGILHIRSGEEGSDDYLVNHSSSILLFNLDGSLRALFSGLPHNASDLADNFLKIVQVSDRG